MKKKKRITYTKERVIIADVLPYEVPITFSNRHFYNFLVDNRLYVRENVIGTQNSLRHNKSPDIKSNGIEFSNGCLAWKDGGEALKKLISFIFNIDFNKPLDINNGICSYSINERVPYKFKFLETIPFTFKISHKQNEFRELAIIHPANQLSVVDFYNNYKELILYYCTKSPYSIRKPHRIAKFTYFNDANHKKLKVEAPERDIIEVFGKEYENLKTFFAYSKKYQNIHKFYESYHYQRSEKKFDKLFKFDITKCFDSIYTHSLSWALFNKEIVKENITVNHFSFGGAWFGPL